MALKDNLVDKIDGAEDEFYEITEEEYREIIENEIPDDLL